MDNNHHYLLLCEEQGSIIGGSDNRADAIRIGLDSLSLDSDNDTGVILHNTRVQRRKNDCWRITLDGRITPLGLHFGQYTRHTRLKLNDAYIPPESGFMKLVHPEELVPWNPEEGSKKASGIPAYLIFSDPRHIDKEDIYDIFEASEVRAGQANPDKHVGFDPANKFWSGFSRSEDGRTETHTLVVFSADNPTDPAGYAAFSRNIALPIIDDAVVDINYSLDHVYIRPECRGRGFGLALARAMSEICTAEIPHLAEAVARTDGTLRIMVDAECMSRGGYRIARDVVEDMQIELEAFQKSKTWMGRPDLFEEHEWDIDTVNVQYGDTGKMFRAPAEISSDLAMEF